MFHSSKTRELDLFSSENKSRPYFKYFRESFWVDVTLDIAVAIVYDLVADLQVTYWKKTVE